MCQSPKDASSMPLTFCSLSKMKLGVRNNVLIICVLLHDKEIITQAISWMTQGMGLDSCQMEIIFLFFTPFKLALGPIQWIPGGKSG
jgi:hypothetical protein